MNDCEMRMLREVIADGEGLPASCNKQTLHWLRHISSACCYSVHALRSSSLEGHSACAE